MALKKKKKIKVQRDNDGLAKIVSSAFSNYKKNKEQNKIRAIKLQKLEERNSFLKEKKDLKVWEDKYYK